MTYRASMGKTERATADTELTLVLTWRQNRRSAVTQTLTEAKPHDGFPAKEQIKQ